MATYNGERSLLPAHCHILICNSIIPVLGLLDGALLRVDPAKDAANKLRHGFHFAEPQLAFLDGESHYCQRHGPKRLEERFYCIGTGGTRVLTFVSHTGKGSSNHRRSFLAQSRNIYETPSKVHK